MSPYSAQTLSPPQLLRSLDLRVEGGWCGNGKVGTSALGLFGGCAGLGQRMRKTVGDALMNSPF